MSSDSEVVLASDSVFSFIAGTGSHFTHHAGIKGNPYNGPVLNSFKRRGTTDVWMKIQTLFHKTKIELPNRKWCPRETKKQETKWTYKPGQILRQEFHPPFRQGVHQLNKHRRLTQHWLCQLAQQPVLSSQLVMDTSSCSFLCCLQTCCPAMWSAGALNCQFYVGLNFRQQSVWLG